MGKITIPEILALVPEVIGDESAIEAAIAKFKTTTEQPSDIIQLVIDILTAVKPLADKVKAAADS